MEVQVPVALLLDQGLTTSAKLVWMLCRLHGSSPPPLSRLADQSGLAAETIREALAKVDTMRTPKAGHAATLPEALLTDPKMPPSAKVLHGILQSQPGQFTYPELSSLTGSSPNTLKRAVAALVMAEWLATEQRSRLAPIFFTLRNPVLARQKSEVELARRRLQHAIYKGEALMKEYLSLLVDSREFEDNARPGFLVNPKTEEPLELDRFYINVAGFEYNGASHSGTSEESKDQQVRDMIKAGICAQRQIPVVVIHSQDLSLDAMRAKIGQLLPLRDLTGHEPLIAFLERRAGRYRAEGAR